MGIGWDFLGRSLVVINNLDRFILQQASHAHVQDSRSTYASWSRKAGIFSGSVSVNVGRLTLCSILHHQR